MRLHNVEAEQEHLAFAKEAGAWFSTHPGDTTFTHEEIEGGCLFAVRWNDARGSVLVFKLAEDFEFEPTIYGRVIPEREPEPTKADTLLNLFRELQEAITAKQNLGFPDESIVSYTKESLENILNEYQQKETL